MSSGPSVVAMSDGVDISEFFSAVFFGSIISFMMLGITVVQYWTYVAKNRDSRGLRCFVLTIVLLNVACTCLLIVHLNSRLILHFGSDMSSLSQNSIPMQIEVLLTTFIIAAVDLFLARQVHVVGQTHWSIVLVIAGAATLAFGISFTVSVITLASPTRAATFLVSRAGIAITATSNTLFTVAEILACVALALSLHRSKTGIKRTDNLLAKLFQWFVTRGLLLSIVQLLSMVIFLAQPSTLNWLPFHLFQSKLYVITTLSLLNSRKSLRRQMNIFPTSFMESTDNGYRSSRSEPESDQHRRRSTIDIGHRFGTSTSFTTPAGIPGDDEESALAMQPLQKAQNSSFAERLEDAFELQKTAASVQISGSRVILSREDLTNT